MLPSSTTTTTPFTAPSLLPTLLISTSPSGLAVSAFPTISLSLLPSLVPSATPTSHNKSVNSQFLICLYGDCTDADTTCVAGAVCKSMNPFYRMCVENPMYAGLANSSCHAVNSDYGCGGAQGGQGCCNPGATCGSDHICKLSRSCMFQKPMNTHQSSAKSPTSSPSSSVSPSVHPVKSTVQPVIPPSHQPAAAAICLYGDCTKSSSTCIAGTICVAQSPYYKQCLEDPAYTTKSNCHVTESDWGCGGAQDSLGCCNPGATCGSDNLCHLSTQCVY